MRGLLPRSSPDRAGAWFSLGDFHPLFFLCGMHSSGSFASLVSSNPIREPDSDRPGKRLSALWGLPPPTCNGIHVLLFPWIKVNSGLAASSRTDLATGFPVPYHMAFRRGLSSRLHVPDARVLRSHLMRALRASTRPGTRFPWILGRTGQRRSSFSVSAYGASPPFPKAASEAPPPFPPISAGRSYSRRDSLPR